MRGIIITLVVVGGLLAAAPLVIGHLERSSHQANTVRLLVERPDAKGISLYREDIPVAVQVGCWLVGAGLAGTGVWLAVRETRTTFHRPEGPGPV